MNKKKTNEESYLVVEQKGWRVILLGLAIATLFSLTFKAVFSPRRIQYEIERVLSSMDSRVQTRVMGAQLSLADGLWPRLAIVIKNLKLETNDPCLFEAKAQIENLVLPIAFTSLLNRNLIFNQVEVGLLSLSMRSERRACVSAANEYSPPNVLDPSLPTSAPSPKVPSEAMQEEPKSSTTSTQISKRISEPPPLVQTMSVESSLLRHIVFQEINFQVEEWPQFIWKLKKVDVLLPSKEESQTRVSGMVSLSSSDSSRFPFQGLNAQLDMESEVDRISVKIHGAWREGRIVFDGFWLPQLKEFKLNGSFKQIPWGQVVILAEALGQKEAIPVSSQAWISGRMNWELNAQRPEQITVSDAQIEGEFGDFVLGTLVIDKKSNGIGWSVSPYKVLAKDVNIELLMKMMGWNEGYSGFDQYGFFNGEAHFLENQLVLMAGTWSDLHIIFSNRGRREFQVVNKINLELKGSLNRWSGALKNIELKEGQWNGDANLVIDQNLKTVDLEAQFNQVLLDPDVVELMTLKGKLSPLDGKTILHFQNGKLDRLKGFLKMESLTLNEINIEKPRLDFEGSNEEVNGRVQVQSIVGSPDRMEYWPQPLPENLEKITFKNISGNILKRNQDFRIKDLQGLIPELKSRFSLNAQTQSSTELNGSLIIRNDRKAQIFQLSGDRAKPVWISQ